MNDPNDDRDYLLVIVVALITFALICAITTDIIKFYRQSRQPAPRSNPMPLASRKRQRGDADRRAAAQKMVAVARRNAITRASLKAL